MALTSLFSLFSSLLLSITRIYHCPKYILQSDILNSFIIMLSFSSSVNCAAKKYNHLSLRITIMCSRSLFNNKKRSPGDWHQRLIQTQNPRELVDTLLSDELTFEEQVKIVLAMPKSATNKLVDVRWLESKLEKHGHHQLCRVVRWNMFWNLDTVSRKNIREWSHAMVKTDIEVRWVMQREAYVREKLHALRKLLKLYGPDSIDVRKKHEIMGYSEELKDLNLLYHAYQKRIWKLKGDVPVGVLTRAFMKCRENPDWYLSAWLRQDCAGRGGCCGRGCGCCEIAGTHREHGQARGHCITACGCCIRTRALEIRKYGGQDDMEDFPFDIVSYKSSYSKQIFRAYIWGLSFLDEMGLCGNYW